MSAPTITTPATSGGGVPVGGSGAAGYLAKWTATTTLGGSTATGATASLYVDATGNVGIGTASPSQRLTVAGGFIATAAGYGVYQPGDHLVLLGGAGKNVHLKPNDGAVLAVNVGATSCDFTGVSNYGLKLATTPGNTDPNTLDCYSELGTGSPTTIAVALTSAGGSITMSATNKIRVTRIGNCVYGSGYLVVSAVSAPTGRLSMTLTGCPQAWINFPCTATFASTNAIPAGSVWLVGSDTAATPTLYLDRYDGASQLLDMAQYVKAGTAVAISFVYQAA